MIAAPAIPASPVSSPPGSETSEVSTSPDTNPPVTTAEALCRRLNRLRTASRRLTRTRDALGPRIDRKLEAHDHMLAGRNFTLDYQAALTKHLNDFLEPLYNDLEETEIKLDEIKAEISQVSRQLTWTRLRARRDDGGSARDAEVGETGKRGLKRRRVEDSGGEDTDGDADVDPQADSGTHQAD